MSEIKVSEMTEATEVNNNDLLMIVQDGINKKVKIDKIKETILFEKEEGEKGNITLNDTIENYREYEIEYFLSTESQGKIFKSTGRISTGNTNVLLSINRPIETNNAVQNIGELIKITGNTIQKNINSYNYNVTTNGFGIMGTGLLFSIAKVRAYK